MQTLKLEIKTVYGVVKAYPMCDQSKLLAKIAGTTTLTSQNLKHIQALGYSFECVSPTLENVQ
jgi:hypothetical protein